MKIEDWVENIDFLLGLVRKNGILGKSRFYIEDENIRLECASLIKDLAEINKNVCPNKIEHNYTVEGKRLICDCRYEGEIRRNDTVGLCFTFASTNQVDYKQMDCWAIVDGVKQKPRLKGTDGLIKKVEILFAKKKKKNETYSVQIHIDLGECILSEREYILSVLKYKEVNTKGYSVSIRFNNTLPPDNLRVYELKRGKMKLEKRLEPHKDGQFKEVVEETDSVSVRAYIFDQRKEPFKMRKNVLLGGGGGGTGSPSR
ncbi:MAG: hypothetical protein IJ141_03885 [Lachnospiraceae bacterium]|nr:hypothetical protein [Lachnospiraceae bacterium]